MTSQPGSLSAFKHRTFRNLWASAVFTNTGGTIQNVGAAWAMTLLTSSQSMVALVQASVTAAAMVVSFAAGVMADSYDRRGVMLAAQTFRMATSVALAVLALAGMLTPWVLLTFTFLIGIGTALHNPSWQASFSDIVPREDLPSAVSMNAMGMNITRSVGPAVGGLIVATLGAAFAFITNAVTHFAIIAALLAWKPTRVERSLPKESFAAGAIAGLRYFAMSPNLISANFRGALFGFAAIPMQALLPLVARDQLGGNALVYGILLAAFGLGAVLGALNAGAMRARFSSETTTKIGSVVFAASSVIVAFSPWTALSVAAVFMAGSAWINVMSLINVAVQMSTPRWVLGRMISLYMTWIFGGMALGSWVWGLVSEHYGTPIAFLNAAGVLVLCALWGLRFPIHQFGGVNLDPLNRFNEPALKLDLNKRSGPILIMVEYLIAQPDVPDFLAAIGKRRRARIRDGAQRWTLLRDLENPDLWLESYHFPTWTAYVRHNERRTVSDDEVIRELARLKQGDGPVAVHRMIEQQTVPPHDDLPRIAPQPENPH